MAVACGQAVTFPMGLRVLPTGNLGISQEIQPKCLSVLSTIMSEGGKGTLNNYISNSLGFQMA